MFYVSYTLLFAVYECPGTIFPIEDLSTDCTLVSNLYPTSSVATDDKDNVDEFISENEAAPVAIDCSFISDPCIKSGEAPSNKNEIIQINDTSVCCPSSDLQTPVC